MRTMHDSTTPWDIPRDAQMVAYYVDGLYAWPQAWLDMFPNAVKVSISAIGARTAQVGDVELGCIWPVGNAVDWVLRARADGYDPTIYVNEMNDWGPCRDAFRRRNVPEPHWWVANYDGSTRIPDGAVAHQYAHPRDGSGPADKPWETGKHYDLSSVRDYWPGVDPKAPGGAEPEEETVYAFDVQEIPATGPEPEEHEAEVVWPPLDGATGLREAWVAGFVPAGAKVRAKHAHWNDAEGNRLDGTDGLNYLADGTVISGPAVLPGKLAPDNAAKLVLVYNATHPVKFTVEVRD